jgi:hypothetical protein
MIKALRAAFDAASHLPDEQQDALAAAILAEIATNKRWDASFANSAESLERLADEALEAHRAVVIKRSD